MMAILGALKSIVDLIKEGRAFIKFMNEKFQTTPEEWVIEISNTMKAARTAKTQTEKLDAARKISNLLRKF